jgi:glycosyltransferase involved in cell wall biosynthesis
MRVAVIVSTYNQPQHLRRALAGYLRQQHPPDELIVADDGSDDETRAVLREFGAQAPFVVRHLRHEHAGWRKNTIFNRALTTVTADYVIVSDGDCIPRPDFIATHVRNARPRTFLAGSDFRLPQNVTDAVTPDDILTGAIFRPARLRQLGLPWRRLAIKLWAGRRLGRLLDVLNFSPGRWGGSNASTWRSGLLAINGFDERFLVPGKEDVEMGERLRNLGYTCRHIRHQTTCLHLNHERGYWRMGEIGQNLAILAETRATRRTTTPLGLAQAASAFTVDNYGAGAR